MYRLLLGDVLSFARHYKGESFHALLCDAPYHLTSITERFGKEGSAEAQYGKDGAFQRASKGFMQKTWDGGDISFRSETWKALGNLLYPGAFGMTFGGSRTVHRMAVAIENAGFIIHPMIGWVYGCLSEDTEILTQDGWKSFDQLLTGYMVACYNISNGNLDYMPIEEVFIYEYSDTAYRIQSDFTDQIVSRNHRCIVEQGGRKVFRQAETLECQESIPILENVSNLQEAIFSSRLQRISQEKNLRCDNLHELQTGEKAATIIKEERQIYYLSSMWKKCMEACCLVTKSKSANLFQTMQWLFTQFRINQAFPQGARWLDRRIGEIISGKSDGRKQFGMERRGYLSKQKRKLSKIQNQICALSKRIYQYGTQRRLCYGTQIISSTSSWARATAKRSGASYQPQSRGQPNRKSDAVCKQQGSQELRRQWKTRTTLASVTPVHYEGIVWCVKVPTGAFVARRNGKVFITGNSGFPKATRIDTQIDRNAPRKHLFGEFAEHFGEQWKKSGVGYDNLIDYFPHYKNSESIGAQFRNWRLGKTVPTKKDFEILQPLIDLSSDYLPLIERIEVEREKVGKGNSRSDKTWFTSEDWDITASATPLAQSWEGHRYGLQALKPALEPIIVFQKPYEGRPVDSITKTGAGALNIDGGRIGTDAGWNYPKGAGGIYSHDYQNGSNIAKDWNSFSTKEDNRPIKAEKGRWPSNFVLTHSPDCQLIGYRDESYQINRFTDGAKPFGDGAGHEFESEEMEGGIPVWECVDGCPVKELDRQSGYSKTKRIEKPSEAPGGNTWGGTIQTNRGARGHTDSGGASRFFHQSHYVPFYYQAKAGVKERNAGLKEQLHDIGHNRFDTCSNCGGTILQNPERPSACKCDNPVRQHRKVRNPHPTVKPIALTRHLATLLLPPEEYKPRRLLVPFAGTASEMIGAFQAGWECVIGVEKEREYVDIGRARLQYWLEQGVQLDLFSA